jgi:hypothetical protein
MMSRKELELRDWYAGLAMQAFISANDSRDWDCVAEEAFEQAAVMMEHRREAIINER